MEELDDDFVVLVEKLRDLRHGLELENIIYEATKHTNNQYKYLDGGGTLGIVDATGVGGTVGT